jgi:hypothetical protein
MTVPSAGPTSAFPDTPRDPTCVTTATRGDRKNRSAPWRTEEYTFSESCGRSTPDGFPADKKYISRSIFQHSEIPE